VIVSVLSRFVDRQYVEDSPERFSWGMGWLRKRGEEGEGSSSLYVCKKHYSGDFVCPTMFRYFFDRHSDGICYLAYGPGERFNYFFKLSIMATLVFFGMMTLFLVQAALVPIRFIYQGFRRGWQNVDELREGLPDICGLITFILGVEIAALCGLLYFFDDGVSARMQVVISRLDREWNAEVPLEETLPYLAVRSMEMCHLQLRQSRRVDVQAIFRNLSLSKRKCCFYLCENFQQIDCARVQLFKSGHHNYNELLESAEAWAKGWMVAVGGSEGYGSLLASGSEVKCEILRTSN